MSRPLEDLVAEAVSDADRREAELAGDVEPTSDELVDRILGRR